MSKDHVRNFPGPKVTLNRQVIIKELTGAFIPFALDIIKQMSASAKESAVNINAAIREGRIDDVVRLVRDHGVSTNFQESEGSSTPLMTAAIGGFADILEFLLNPGRSIARADVNKQDREQRTALINAALNNRVDCVTLLMEHGADPNLYSRNGWTPLYIAANKGYTEIAKTLLFAHGSNIPSRGSTSYHALNVNMAIQNTVGGTVLMVACMQGHYEIVKYLLESGADLNLKDKQNWTALMRAADKGHVEVVKLLLAYDADVQVANNIGFTALHLAAKTGKEAAVEVLLCHPQIEVNCVDRNNRTPLYYAAEKKHLETVRMLLTDSRADVTIADNIKGVTALTVPSTPEIQALLQAAPRVSATAVMASRIEELRREIDGLNPARAQQLRSQDEVLCFSAAAPESVVVYQPQEFHRNEEDVMPRELHTEDLVSRGSQECEPYQRQSFANAADFSRHLKALTLADKMSSELCEYCIKTDFEVWGKLLQDDSANANPIMKDLRTIFEVEDEDVRFKRSIELGRTELVKLFATQGLRGSCTPQNTAARMGRVDYMKFLASRDYRCDSTTSAVAAANGQLECLKFAHESGCLCDERVAMAASAHGHVECLMYALDKNFPVDLEEACRLAYEGNHVACMRLLWDENTCASAAALNDLVYVQYLCEHGCPWDERTTDSAALRGFTDVLGFALSQECPYSDNLVAFAVYSGVLDCVHYIVYLSGVYLPDDVSLFGAAFEIGNVEIMRFLCDCGFPLIGYTWHGDRRDPTLSHAEWDVRLRDCIVLAVERGWFVNSELEFYVVSEQLELCELFLLTSDMTITPRPRDVTDRVRFWLWRAGGL